MNHPTQLMTRNTFAWLPVECFSKPNPFTRQQGWYWLSRVELRLTLFDGWRAYAHENQNVPIRPDWCIVIVATMALALGFIAATAALYPAVAYLLS